MTGIKKKWIGGVQKVTSWSLEWANRWQYRCVCNKEWFRQERGSSLSTARGSRVQVTWLKASRIIQVGGSRSPSIQSRPLSLRLRHFLSPKRLWGANDSPRTMTSCSTCGTGSQRSPGNFTRQPFTALCHSGTSALTSRGNTSDIQVLVSVPRPPARFFFNAPYTVHFRHTGLGNNSKNLSVFFFIEYFYL